MIELRGAAALLDIEGTLGSIAFVRDVLFPYADERMDAFVEQHRREPGVRQILERAAGEAGVEADDTPAILAALHAWSAKNEKITPLKSLQGLIWKEGYERHGVSAHVYPDAVAALRRFAGDGIPLYVYSSGSIAAQRLLFGHSAAGDLLPLMSGLFDTTIGSKLDPASYARIAGEIATPPGEIVFFSDNSGELDAASAAGLQTVQLARPEDATVRAERHPAVTTFDDVSLHAGTTVIP
ncbi:MAG: acireductone synthase [Vulcanimicrobiaceae bacterium]